MELFFYPLENVINTHILFLHIINFFFCSPVDVRLPIVLFCSWFRKVLRLYCPHSHTLQAIFQRNVAGIKGGSSNTNMTAKYSFDLKDNRHQCIKGKLSKIKTI